MLLSSSAVRLVAASLAAAGLIGASAPPSVAMSDPDRLPFSASITRAATPPTAAERALARMSPAQRVGQLFMVGTPATTISATTRRQIGRYHVGNVMLTGRSWAGTEQQAQVVDALQRRTGRAATAGARLLVSSDQEGGAVQVLHGDGISEIPSGLAQGRLPVHHLETAAGRWARQLRASGVNMNLASVLDTVPGPAAARRNPPIGAFDRQYGYSTTRVTRHGLAFARGMDTHGVAPVAKHFPGLGRVHANPDVRAGVTDPVTRRGDPYLDPFRRAVAAGVPVVMMSTAYYPRLDRTAPAAFSPFVIGTVLRGDLGFRGVVMSDDLGSARQVARWSYAARAVKFIRAGGDLVLTVNPAALPGMYRAVLTRARRSPAFRAQVNRAALRVLRVKERQHLLGGSPRPARSDRVAAQQREEGPGVGRLRGHVHVPLVWGGVGRDGDGVARRRTRQPLQPHEGGAEPLAQLVLSRQP